MSAAEVDNRQLQATARKMLSESKSVIEKLRASCLLRGATGIHGFGRMFRIMDDDGNRTLSREEFMKGCRDYGCQLSREEFDELFKLIDRDNSGCIVFDELLKALRLQSSEMLNDTDAPRQLSSEASSFEHEDQSKDAFYGVLVDLRKWAEHREINILDGDSIVRLSRLSSEDKRLGGMFGVRSQHTDNGERLLRLCATHCLYIWSASFQYRKRHCYLETSLCFSAADTARSHGSQLQKLYTCNCKIRNWRSSDESVKNAYREALVDKTPSSS
ncbi:uncharacterized protein DEA37_0015113 [Paragonimus westermani]|uniref:EF-hand domain-containing protein n=1 Tax=Paragonimus westermani TaxID=34504 RepID=A0A5J4N3S6_9TREM|nr:uncharacterized protein DEA37_0015113 [Paragonimus westermani]